MNPNQNSSLLIHPALIVDESLGGYLERIFLINRYKNISWLCKQISVPVHIIHNNLVPYSKIKDLSKLTHKTEEELLIHTLSFWKEKFPDNTDKYFLKRNIKYCPVCIHEHHTHKLSWGFQMVSICLKHKCLLVDRCTNCQENIRMGSFMKGYCLACGLIYGKCKVTFYNEYSPFYQSQDEIQKSCFVNKLMLYEDLGGINFMAFLKLSEASFYILNGLTSMVDDSGEIRIFTKKDQKKTNDLYLSAYSNVYWMYKDFPNHFNIILASWFKNRNKKMFYEQKEKFERVIDEFPIVKTANIHYWLDAMNEGIIRKDFSLFKQDLTLLNKRNVIRKEEVKALSGMGYKKIEQMAFEGKLEMLSKRAGNTNKYLITLQSYYSLKEESSLNITRNEAAKLLGIKKVTLTEIINNGLISEEVSSINQNKKLIRNQVINLMEKCRGTYKTNAPQGDLSFHKALIKYSVNGLSAAKLIQFIVNGSISPISTTTRGTLADSYYSIAKLEKCIRMLRNKRQNIEGYYMTEVLRILRIGEKKMWGFVNSGCLIPDKVTTFKDGRKRYFFKKETIETFQNYYMK